MAVFVFWRDAGGEDLGGERTQALEGGRHCVEVEVEVCGMWSEELLVAQG